MAYNNLSGRTPARVGQFATFEEQCYEGNGFLCGTPLPDCGTNSSRLHELSDEGTDDSFRFAFQWGFIGFLGVVAFLYYEPYYSMLFFEFIGARFRIIVLSFGWR